MSEKNFYDWEWSPLQDGMVVAEATTGESVNMVATLFVEAEIEIGKTIFKNLEKIFLNYDLFFDEVTDEWLFEIFNTIYECKKNKFYVYSKNIKRMKEYIEKFMNKNNIKSFDNLIVGCLVENQDDVNTLISPFLTININEKFIFISSNEKFIDLMFVKLDKFAEVDILSGDPRIMSQSIPNVHIKPIDFVVCAPSEERWFDYLEDECKINNIPFYVF